MTLETSVDRKGQGDRGSTMNRSEVLTSCQFLVSCVTGRWLPLCQPIEGLFLSL